VHSSTTTELLKTDKTEEEVAELESAFVELEETQAFREAESKVKAGFSESEQRCRYLLD